MLRERVKQKVQLTRRVPTSFVVIFVCLFVCLYLLFVLFVYFVICSFLLFVEKVVNINIFLT